MRKHFLLLFLMTLIPFYGWAAIDWTTAPVADDDLVYTGAAQNLLSTLGTPATGTATYAVTLAGAAQPADGYTADGYTATNAAEYTVWVKVGTEVESIPASIAIKPLVITLNLGAGEIEETDYTGAVINPNIKVDGAALADPYVATWSSQIKNAGSYTVTVQNTVTVGEVVFVNEEGTADFLVNKVPLSVNAKHVTITYGDAAVENNALYTATGWKGTDATDPEVNNLVVNVNFGGAQPTNAGVHPFTITAGTVNNYAVTVSVANANLTIEKKALTIQAVAGAGFDYGEVTSYAPTYTYDGLLAADANTDGTPKDGVLNSDVTFTAIAAGDVNFFNTDGSIKGNAGSYVITPVVVGSGTPLVQSNNYTVTCSPTDGTVTKPNLVVAPKSLAHTHVTIAAIPSQEYAGTALTPVITITDSNVYGEEKTLTVTTDYTVAWDGTLLNAGAYTGTFTGVNNYTTPATAPTKTFTITKAPLTIIIDTDLTKVYDNAEYNFANAWNTYCEVYGVKNNEPYKDDNPATNDVFTVLPTLTYDAVAGSKINVGNYVVTIANNTGTSSNYDVVVEDGALSITKQPIYLLANDINQVYGKAEKTLTYAVYGNATYTGAPLVASINNESKDNTYMATAAVLTREAGTGYGDYAITFTSEGAAKGNFEIKGTKAGTYSITKANLRIIAENKTKVYDGIEPVQSANNAASEVNLTYKVVGLIDGDELTTAPTLTKEAGVDVDTYTITAAGAVVNHPENYNSISYQTGTYEITAKALTVTAKQQGMNVGETADEIDQTAYTFGDGIIAGDETQIELSIVFATVTQAVDPTHPYATTQVLVNGGGEITDANLGGVTSATLVGGLVFDATATAGAKAGNYTITYVPGDLLITAAAEAITLSGNSTNVATLNGAAGKKVNVKFANRSLKKGQWNVLVLPFATTVREISNALGYAVVDVIDPSKGDKNNVYFKLHLGAIEANTPFMVKTDATADIDMSAIGATVLGVENIVFTGKTIVKDIDTEGKTSGVAGAAGTKFYGLYAQKAVSGAKQWYMAGGKWVYVTSGNTPVDPLRAYLQLDETADPSSARIFIEEPDGTTTAIKAVEVNGLAVGTEGWYTVNGMKLNSVPTEKGIYIHNGKKVVLK